MYRSTQPTFDMHNNKDLMVGKDSDGISNTRVSFADKKDAMFSSTSKLSSKQHVFGDLVEAQEDKSRVSNLLSSSHWQHDKDSLVDSMNHHMHKYRSRVKLSVEQKRKRNELAGRSLQGNKELKERLSHQYGIKDISAVNFPPETLTYLKEVPDLINNKT